MIDLKELYGKIVKVTVDESCESHDKRHFYIIQGKRGLVAPWDDQSIEVTVYGVVLKLKPDVLPEKTHNLSLPIKLERSGWQAKNHYDDSTVFIVPLSKAEKAFKIIKARHIRQISPETRKMLSERLFRMRSSKNKSHKNGVLNAEPTKKAPEATND